MNRSRVRFPLIELLLVVAIACCLAITGSAIFGWPQL